LKPDFLVLSALMAAPSSVCMISTNLRAKLLMAVGVVTTTARVSRALWSFL
jgi:hypothetical protein